MKEGTTIFHVQDRCTAHLNSTKPFYTIFIKSEAVVKGLLNGILGARPFLWAN